MNSGANSTAAETFGEPGDAHPPDEMSGGFFLS